MLRLRRRRAGDDTAVVGPARIDRRTKNLIPRLQPGDVAVIDHDDIDRVAAEGLVAARPAAIVNAAPSLTGRYPTLGAMVIVQAGIPLVDEVGSPFLDQIAEGQPIGVDDHEVLRDGRQVARGVRQDRDRVDRILDEARDAIAGELERFAANTLSYIQSEEHLLTATPVQMPALDIDLEGRHALIVVRGIDFHEDLEALRRIGYVNELKPVLIGVDGGADALIDQGYRPDIIIGDFDSVSADAIRSGAQLVVHAYPNGDAPGAARLDRLGMAYDRMEVTGTSEDAAMQLAFEHRAELIVAVGTHTSMNEFFDKGREGMASTFLTRMKVGQTLVDAKGVSRLYRTQVRKRDLTLLVLSALFTLVIIVVVTEPLRLLLRSVGIGF